MGDFVESQHPRDPGGKFAVAEGVASKSAEGEKAQLSRLAQAKSGLLVGPGHKDYWEPAGGWKGTTPDAVAQQIAGLKQEVGVAWDENGRMIGSYSSGKDNQAAIPDEVLGKATVQMHVHPSSDDPSTPAGAGFSPGDLDHAMWCGLKETTVVSKIDGVQVTYHMKGFDKWHPGDIGAKSVEGAKIAERLKKITEDSDFKTSRPFTRGTWGEDPSQSFGWATRVHYALREVAKEYNLEYSADWRGRIGSTDKVGTLDDALAMGGL